MYISTFQPSIISQFVYKFIFYLCIYLSIVKLLSSVFINNFFVTLLAKLITIESWLLN